MKLPFLVIFVSFVCPGAFKNVDYRVGGLFSDVVHQAAFHAAINELNGKNTNSSFQLLTESLNVSYYNTFEARKGACALLERGIIGLFGPSSSRTSHHIQAICDYKEIPHVETHHDPKIERNKCVVNLHPHPDEIARFFAHLILAYDWRRLVILFEDNESLLRLASLLELNVQHGIQLIFRQLDRDAAGSYRDVLGAVKKTNDRHVLLDCSTDVLEEVLRQAQQVGLMAEDYKYIVTNLDMATLDLSPFQYGGTNITGIRLFDPDGVRSAEFNKEILDVLKVAEEERHVGWKMRVSTALLVDGVRLFYHIVKELLSIQPEMSSVRLGCNGTKYWKYGYTIANQLKGVKGFAGITGKIEFDREGFRRHFDLDVVELTRCGLIKVGEWNSTTRVLNANRTYVRPSGDEEEAAEESGLFNRTFKVITCLTAPYAMLKETTDQLTGNDRFEGFCVDIVRELSSLLGFNYTFLIQADGANGNLNRTTNQWNGVIREIIDGRADLAITDLTITSERENAVDFTMPFMNLGISILYKKPEPMPPSLFMFTSPFSTAVWLMLGVAYLLVSIAIFVMGRLSPSEWTNPFPCVEEPDYLVNQFSMRNSLWFTIGGLLQQGSELAPMSVSTRTASGFWWFFVLIMVSSYTANLAAFLTVETLVTPFKNTDELAGQKEIRFGAKRQGATENFFRDSNVSVHRKIWEYLREHPDVMTSDNDAGVRRVETENYAYFMESVTIEYVVQRHCALAQVGGLLDDKGYGIAIKKYSPHRNELSRAILKLQETGRLTQLKIKWWKEKRGGSSCAVKSEGAEAEALGLKNVGGVFLVMFVGAILALFGSFVEMAASVYRRCKLTNTPFARELKKEMVFIVRLRENVKDASAVERLSGNVKGESHKASF